MSNNFFVTFISNKNVDKILKVCKKGTIVHNNVWNQISNEDIKNKYTQ